MRLRDGSTTQDPRLDRLEQFDERSRTYPIMAVVEQTKPRSYTWRCEAWLDQRKEGACVGFSWAHELAAKPKPRMVDEPFARFVYLSAQKIDEWSGEAYEGTSVIAGAKIMQAQNMIGEYRWAFGLDQALVGISRKGPAVLGIPWHEGMFSPGSDGFIRATGDVMGGHAILANGVSLRKGAVRLHNSWGRGWGQGGECWISFDDLGSLLEDGGECCIPLDRR